MIFSQKARLIKLFRKKRIEIQKYRSARLFVSIFLGSKAGALIRMKP